MKGLLAILLVLSGATLARAQPPDVNDLRRSHFSVRFGDAKTCPHDVSDGDVLLRDCANYAKN